MNSAVKFGFVLLALFAASTLQAQREKLPPQDLEYVEKTWPDEYWPPRDANATRVEWDQTIRDFRADLAALIALVRDPSSDLFAVLPDTPGHTLIRQVRIVGDHNAYHIGEFAALRQVMGTWGLGHR